MLNEKATKSHRYYDFKFARYVEEKDGAQIALVFIVTLQGISCYFSISFKIVSKTKV